MEAQVIDGRKMADRVLSSVNRAARALEQEYRVTPGLAVIIVGDDPASHTYVTAKTRTAQECGFSSVQHTLPAETAEVELMALIGRLNEDASVHGILVQLPLPSHLDADRAIQSIRPEKDVDGLNVVNAGKLATGDMKTGLVSCTPAGAMLLIEQVLGSDLAGLSAVVIGRSNLFGKPMTQLLLNANATVTMAHSNTSNLPAVCRSADILVAAVGRQKMVQADWVKPGATVIDVGINRIEDDSQSGKKSRLVGDVDFDMVKSVATAITPVPGGVGPMTIAMLMANTARAAWRATAQKEPSFCHQDLY